MQGGQHNIYAEGRPVNASSGHTAEEWPLTTNPLNSAGAHHYANSGPLHKHIPMYVLGGACLQQSMHAMQHPVVQVEVEALAGWLTPHVFQAAATVFK